MNILVIDKYTLVYNNLKSMKDFEVIRTPQVPKVLDLFSHQAFDIVLWDINTILEDEDYGLEILEVITKESPQTQVVMMSHEKDKSLAIECLSHGAYHYLVHPIAEDELVELTESAFTNRPQVGYNSLLEDETNDFFGLRYVSSQMAAVVQQIKEAASSDVSVLISGETGSGKDIVAQALHQASNRSTEPFVSVHTGAIPTELIASELFGYSKGAYTGADNSHEGRFEQAQNGTIFLDELGTMDEKTQVSLLRVLETKTVQRIGSKKKTKLNVRVVGATNEDLFNKVQAGEFREDLFYRFEVFHISIPPLRQRVDDLEFLLNFFLNHFNSTYQKEIQGFSEKALTLCKQYSWPGNVRELKNFVQRAALLCDTNFVTLEQIPKRMRQEQNALVPQELVLPLGLSLKEVEKRYLDWTLKFAKNKSTAAKSLGIARKTLYAKIEGDS